MSIESYSKTVAKEVLQTVTLPLAKRLRIEQQPGLLGRIHNVRVPKNTRTKPEPGPGGGANVKIIFQLLESALVLDGAVAECGVWQGATVIPMGLFLRQHGSRKPILGFDSFEGLDDTVQVDMALGGDDEDRKTVGGFSNTSHEKLVERIRQFGLGDTVRLVKGYFNDTLMRHASEQFCFVHLDCVIYESYKSCIEFFYPRLAKGGVILFDEYNDPPWPGCARAVDEYLADKPEKLVEISSDNQTKYYLRKL
jgi:O-methyltransferase